MDLTGGYKSVRCDPNRTEGRNAATTVASLIFESWKFARVMYRPIDQEYEGKKSVRVHVPFSRAARTFSPASSSIVSALSDVTFLFPRPETARSVNIYFSRYSAAARGGLSFSRVTIFMNFHTNSFQTRGEL